MSHITRRQHYVPDFYLDQWADSAGRITCHDLTERKSFSCNPANVLVQSYFYEEDPAQPDNRIEKLLSAMEGVCSATFKKLFSSGQVHAANSRDAARSLQSAITDADADNFSEFAAYQYMRVPGAIDQKAYEVQPSEISEADRLHALNPGRFVESGFNYVKDRFKAMKMLIMTSPGRPFITSDWPCFDMKDSLNSPLLGEEIGRNPDVVCYLPFSPQFGAVFYAPHFSATAQHVPRVIVAPQDDAIVKNQNVLVVQKAERFVVASRREDYIFTIADKRKKR